MTIDKSTTEPLVEDRSWSVLQCTAFRFVCAYLILYNLPFPLGALPFTEYPGEKYLDVWKTIIPWIGKHILHLSKDIAVLQTGSGDTTFNYVQVLCFLALSALVTLIWSIADRKRTNYIELHQWLRLYIRFVLANAMFTYGACKVFNTQFPAPFFWRLLETYGESSPMGLLWTFMGSSKGYTMFGGLAEVFAGLLLIVPRLTVLGALVCFAVLTNIFMLNMCYDVPVKLYSFHLLLMAVFLLMPDFKKLIDFFLLNRKVALSSDAQLFQRPWLNRGLLVVQLCIGGYFLGAPLYAGYESAKTMYNSSLKSPFYGIWLVDEFEVDGKVLPPLVTDETCWRRVAFDIYDMFTVQHADGSRQTYHLKLDAKKETIALPTEIPNWKAEFRYKKLDGQRLVLDGVFCKQRIHAILHRGNNQDFRLTSRGFHWINEHPFNR
ncbi:MAG: hypothetical protein K2Y22_02280 [Candidatus Obscuribacterales bacterium]|nr:hypothetical protein [Candidatus Obscuribacterales bacterium]